jgi:hypothetical protein
MNTYNSIFDIPTPPTPTNSAAGFFQLYGLPTSDLPDEYTPTRSPTTKRLLKLSGDGSYGRSPICTPFPIDTPKTLQCVKQCSPNLAEENASLREELRQAKLALQASEERRSEVEEESDYLAECLSEALDLLEHRAAVHKARVATLEHEVLQEKAELKEANERLLKEKQQRMASLTVCLDCLLLVWFGLVWFGWLVGCYCCCYCCWVFIGFLFAIFVSLFFLPFF